MVGACVPRCEEAQGDAISKKMLLRVWQDLCERTRVPAAFIIIIIFFVSFLFLSRQYSAWNCLRNENIVPVNRERAALQ